MFTAQELAELAAFDAEVERDFELYEEEVQAQNEFDLKIKMAARYSFRYYQKNKERIAEYQRQYYQANKERIAERQKQYCQANKERIAEYQRQYRQDNKERIAEKKSARLKSMKCERLEVIRLRYIRG